MIPINLNKQGNSVSQWFGNRWIADRDQIIGGVQIRKGDDVYKKCFNLDGHNGDDFSAPLGEPIYAIFSGYIIEQTSKDTGYGLRICQRFMFRGRYYMAVYGHMQRLERDESFVWNWLTKRYPVREGQVVGYVNSTGFSGGNHLHLGVYECDENGNYLQPNNGYGGCIDPWPLLKGHKMSNTLLVKREGTDELGWYTPQTSEEALKTTALNYGYLLPEKADGSLDWDKIKPDLTAKPV